MSLEHPFGSVSWETRGYWEGAGRGELVIQRCGACGTTQHKPRNVCATCLSNDIEHVVATGRGTVYTFTVTNQNQTPPFAGAVPYVMAYVKLEEGPQILTNIVGCDPAEVAIGMAVRADFQAVSGEDGGQYGVVRFVPA
jgi:hypothetical protein